MDNEKLELLQQFVLDDIALLKLKPWTESVNFFEIVKNAKSEIRHSSILAWLLDAKGSHGLKDDFVREFIKVAISKSSDGNIDIFDWAFIDFECSTVITEWSHNGTKDPKKRLDILVLFENEHDKKLLAIENKTTSSEHKAGEHPQTTTYKNNLSESYKDYKKLLVYLTPKEEDPQDEDWNKLSYKDIVKILDATLQNKIIKNSIHQNVKLILNNYREIIYKYLIDDDLLIQTCNNIYAKHQEALDFIFYHSPHFKSNNKNRKADAAAIETCEKIRLRFEAELDLIYENKKSPTAVAADFMRQKIEGHSNFTWGKEMGSGKRYIMFTSKRLNEYIPPIEDDNVFGSWNKSKDTYRLWIDTADYSNSNKKLKFALELGGDNLPPTTESIHKKIIEEFGKGSTRSKYTFKQIISQYRNVDISKEQELEDFLDYVFKTVADWEDRIIACLSK